MLILIYQLTLLAIDFVSRKRSSNTTSSGTPVGFNKTDPIDVGNSTLSAFENEWCRNWASTPHFNNLTHKDQLEPRFPGLNDSSKRFCLSLEAANYSSWAVIFASRMAKAWTPVFTTPCCNPFCSFRASAFELLWWPTRHTTTPVHNVTTAVGQDGFIL